MVIGAVRLFMLRKGSASKKLLLPLLLVIWPMLAFILFVTTATILSANAIDVNKVDLIGKYQYKYCSYCENDVDKGAVFVIDSNYSFVSLDSINLGEVMPRRGRINYFKNASAIDLMSGNSSFSGFVERDLSSFDIGFYCGDPDDGYCVRLYKATPYEKD